jgi:hypothetical protein
MSVVEAPRIVAPYMPNTHVIGAWDKLHAYSEPTDERVTAPVKGECKTSNIPVVIKAVEGKSKPVGAKV